MNTLHWFLTLTFSYNLITKLEQKGQPQKDQILLFAQRKLVSVQRETLEQKERKCFSRRCPEPIFLNLLRSPGIDSQTGGPVRHPYWRTGPPGYIGWQNRFLESTPGLVKRLQIRAQLSRILLSFLVAEKSWGCWSSWVHLRFIPPWWKNHP